MPLIRYRVAGGAWVEADVTLPFEITATATQDVEVQGLSSILIDEGVAPPISVPSYSAAPATNAFAESPIAGMRVFSDAISLTVFGLNEGVTESGDGVVQLASNPDTSNPRDQLIECSTAAGTGHAFHAELLRFLAHDSLMPEGSSTAANDPETVDTTMSSVYWQCEFVPVSGEAKFFAAYADSSQATELFYFGIADAGDGTFRFVTNGTVGTRAHTYGDMVKARLSRTAAGAITLESNMGGSWLSEGSLTSQTTTAITSFRWGCFGATKATDIRYSATSISDTGFTEMDRNFYDIGSGTRAFDQTRATPVMCIPDGMFTGQTQARVRWAAGSDPSTGTPTAWVALTNRQQNAIPLPITGLAANTRYSYQFEVGNASDAVVWTSEAYSFKTLQTLGSSAAGSFAVEGCHAQVPFAHPYRDTQHTLDNIDDNHLFTLHGGDMGYEAGATANLARYMRNSYPTDADGFERVLRDYFSDYDMHRLQKAGPYIAIADDHAVINNVDLDGRGSTQLANDFQPGKVVSPGWGTATVGDLWTAGLSVQDAWFYSHQYDLPADEGAEPARYWKLGHGETEYLFLDTRWTRTEAANRQVSIQQKAWIDAQIDALQSTTKLVIIFGQTPFTNFTAKTGDSWEGVAQTQYNSLVDYVAANLPTGCKALFVASDDHVGFLFHDEVTTATNTSTPANIIGEVTAAGGANRYRFDNPDTSSALWRLNPGSFTTGNIGRTYIKTSGVLVDVNATANAIELSAQVDSTESTYTALAAPTLSALTLPATANQSQTIAITGATDGSTITANTLPTNWTLDSANRQITIGASAATGSQSWELVETLAGGTNSPRTSSGSTTVSAGGYSYTNTEAQTYINAMTVEPSDTFKGHVDTFYSGLKTDGIYTKLGFMYLLATPTEQGARLDMITPASNTLTGSPTFTADRGFTSDGTNLLDTGVAESAVTNMTETSATFGLWVNSSDETAGNLMGAASTSRLNPRAGSGNVSGRCFSGQTSNDLTVANRLGLSVVSRTGTSQTCGRNAGSDSAVTTATTSNSPTSDTFEILGATGTAHTGADRVAFAFAGGYLTQTERQNLHTRVNTLLTAIGAA